jgi:hypothetical protein
MTYVGRGVRLLALLLIGVGPAAAAQGAAPAAVTGARAFAAEALGGTVGSALGIAIGLAVAKPTECPSADDVVCTLRRLGITGIIGVAGATIGTTVAGRWAGTDPSLIGAFVGAAAGAAAGIGLEHLITEEMGQSIGNAGTLVLFSVAQGILAAAGSRLGSRLAAISYRLSAISGRDRGLRVAHEYAAPSGGDEPPQCSEARRAAPGRPSC